jgi:chromosome partitioning protein
VSIVSIVSDVSSVAIDNIKQQSRNSMKTIAFVTQKGGSGKTTLSASIAVAATEAGENVVVLDLDPQGSLAGWGERRDSETPAIDRLVGDRLVQLPQILKGLEARGFTLVVLDCPGFLSTAGNMAMECIDLALVPTRPTTLDLHAAVPTTRALGKFEKQFLFVLNQCLPGSKSRANEAAAGLRALGFVADSMIVQRTDHQDALAAGRGVTEYAPDGKAADEIRALWACVSKALAPRKELVA